MLTSRERIMGATWIRVAVVFFSASGLAAGDGTVQAAINKAQKEFLAKQRPVALETLRAARESAGVGIKDRAALDEAILEIANRFLTDKGQRLFELGVSQLPHLPANAIRHLREVAELEAGNLQVQLGLARALLASEECRAADAELAGPRRYGANLEVVVELDLIIRWCLKDRVGLEAYLKRKPAEGRLSAVAAKLVQAWLKWDGGDAAKGAALTREALTLEPNNPATLYWLWQMSKDLEEGPSAAAVAFVKRCRRADADFRRRQGSMIEMCLRRGEVEAYLKSKGVETSDPASNS